MSTVPLFKCDLDQDAAELVRSVFESGSLAAGAYVTAVENKCADMFSGRPVVACSDMTHALTLALQLAGVGPGDEVLTLSYNCLSSNSAIAAIGAKPVWVDIDPERASMSIDSAEAGITPKTKALVVYHVAGYPADLESLAALCQRKGLVLIEDANNAIGASINGKTLGTVGDFAVFSFYANRQVNGIEGAVLVCRDVQSAQAARRLRRFGIDAPIFRDASGEIDPAADIATIGMSAALTNVNAALALQGLEQLGDKLERTRQNAAFLRDSLHGVRGLRPVCVPATANPAYWVWLTRCDDRDRVLVNLKKLGIQCSKLHQPNHSYSGFDAKTRPLPGTARFMEEVLALPCGWWLDEQDLRFVVDAIRNQF